MARAKPRQQPGAVARIDLDHGGAGRRASAISTDGATEKISLAARRSAGAGGSQRRSPPSALHRLDQPLARWRGSP